MPENQAANPARDVAVIDEIRPLLGLGDVKLSIDRTGAAFIHFRGDLIRKRWPLRHRRVRAWLAILCLRKIGEVLTDVEGSRILTVLEGYAWDHATDIADAEIMEAIEQDALLEMVIDFVENAADQRFEGLVSDLLPKLTTRAKARGVIGRSGRRWPGSAFWFGRRLREHEDLLRHAGIELSIRHTNRGSRLRLAMTRRDRDGTAVTASPVSSSHNVDPDIVLPSSDGSITDEPHDDIIATLDKLKGTSQ